MIIHVIISFEDKNNAMSAFPVNIFGICEILNVVSGVELSNSFSLLCS